MSETNAPRGFDEYLTIAEAAAHVGVSPWTLRNWDRAGKLKAIRHPVNGYRIYRLCDLEAILQTDAWLGRRKGTLAPSIDWSEIGASEHFVQFYETDAYLLDSVAAFIGKAIVAGDGALVIATQAHRNRLHRKLKARGLDLSVARAAGQYVAADAAETLSQVLVDGCPNQARFIEVIGGLVARTGKGKRLRAFGEMVALLWADGDRDGAHRLEQLWNELGEKHAFALLCAYPLSGFGKEADGAPLAEVCSRHSRVIPAESYAALSTPDEQLRAITVLQQKARALEAEVARREEALRELSDFVERAVVIPAVKQLTVSAEMPITPRPAGRRVLVVDDNVDAAASLALLLEMSGHEVRIAHDGPSALEAAREYLPDVAVLDIGLPGLDGLEIAKRLREQPPLDGIVLIAMTGYAQEADQRRSREAGFDRHLVKPVDFCKVEEILSSSMGARS
jgi:CheY-like chemotaxis protein